MVHCRVIADHNRSYEHPIVGIAGEVVISHRDDEAPGWIWCEHAVSGRTGWVPEAFLERGDKPDFVVLRRDYSAMELTAVAGQILETFETVAGWTWCRSADGDAGWVPTLKLTAS